jgi:hypothetical protein
VLKHGRWVELAGAADGRVPGQVLVYFVAEEIENIQPQSTVLDQAPVTDDMLQAAHQHELKEDDGVERGLARVAVKILGLLVEKRSIEELGQPAVEMVAGHALGQAKAQHDAVGELLVALHRPKVPLARHLLLQQPRPNTAGLLLPVSCLAKHY